MLGQLWLPRQEEPGAGWLWAVVARGPGGPRSPVLGCTWGCLTYPAPSLFPGSCRPLQPSFRQDPGLLPQARRAQARSPSSSGSPPWELWLDAVPAVPLRLGRPRASSPMQEPAERRGGSMAPWPPTLCLAASIFPSPSPPFKPCLYHPFALPPSRPSFHAPCTPEATQSGPTLLAVWP